MSKFFPLPAFFDLPEIEEKVKISSFISYSAGTALMHIEWNADIVNALKTGADIAPYNKYTIMPRTISFFKPRDIPLTSSPEDVKREHIYYDISRAQWMMNSFGRYYNISLQQARTLADTGVPIIHSEQVENMIPDMHRL